MAEKMLEGPHLDEHDNYSPDDEIAANLLQEIYENWSYVTFDKEEHEVHKPRSKKEINYAIDRLPKLDSLDIKIVELKERTNDIREEIRLSQNRRFIGSWWIIGGVSLFLLISIYSFGISEMTKDYTLEQADRMLNSEISTYQRFINNTLAQPEESRNMDALANYQSNLEELKTLDAESYREKRLTESFWRGFRHTMGQIPMILFVFAYFFASKAPEYLIRKREREMQLTMRGAGTAKKALIGIMGFFIAAPWITVYDVHADGSKSFSDDNLTSGVLQLLWKFGIPLLIALIVMYTMMIVLPVLTLVNYLRNYQDQKLQLYVDKAKGLFASKKIA